MFSEDKSITILYYSMRHLLIPISLLFAFSNCFSNEQDRSRKAAFALFVEIPSTDIDISHAEYARDRIAAELTRLNFSIVTSDTVTRAVKSLRGNIEQNAYKSFSDNNMQSLAIQLGADYLMHLTINDFSSEYKDLPRFDRKIYSHRLSANFRVISSSTSASVFGKSLSAEKKIPVTSNIIIEKSKSGLINELINQISDELVDYVMDMESRNSTVTKQSNARQTKSLSQLSLNGVDNVNVTIIAQLKGLAWPSIEKNENGDYIFNGVEQRLEATDAEIEVDGLFVGNCSGETAIPIPSGIRRLKVSRSGYVVTEKMINAHEGMSLTLLLEPSDEEYRKWREQLIFLQNVKRGEKLTDAEVKQAEGLYEYLKNSKFEVPSSVTNNTIFK